MEHDCFLKHLGPGWAALAFAGGTCSVLAQENWNVYVAIVGRHEQDVDHALFSDPLKWQKNLTSTLNVSLSSSTTIPENANSAVSRT